MSTSTTESTLGNVFRFVQMRPTTAIPDTDIIVLRDGTALAVLLNGSKKTEWRDHSLDSLKRATKKHRSIEDFPNGTEAVKSVDKALASKDAALSVLQEEVVALGISADQVQYVRSIAVLSDLLLAATFAGPGGTHYLTPANRRDLTKLYQAYDLAIPDASQPNLEQNGAPVLRRPLALPPSLYAKSEEAESEKADQVARGPAHYNVSAAIEELQGVGKLSNLVLPAEEDVDEAEEHEQKSKDRKPKRKKKIAAAATPFALTEAAAGELSIDTTALLNYLEIDPKTSSIERVIATLEGYEYQLGKELYLPPIFIDAGGWTIPSEPDIFDGEQVAYRYEAGIADLLVVKQQIKRYEAAEIAHVENVMKGETRERTHRLFSRREETLFSETEVTTEEERELETADRFELNRETEKTLKKDRKMGFNLSLSGKYGPTVEFSSNLSLEASQVQEESSKSATKFSKDVVERSLSKITERVKESRTLTIVRESEETNLHKFEGSSDDDHIVGIYQFLDKVYEAQVFNYGLRQMFDFMVPEPASFLWHIESQPEKGAELPTPPIPLSRFAAKWQDVTSANYKALQTRYGAEDILSPPPYYRSLSASVNHGSGNGESGQPKSVEHQDMDVPKGYRPVWARATAQCFTDDHPYLLIQIGHGQKKMNFTSQFLEGLSGNRQIGRMTKYFYDDMVGHTLEEGGTLGIDVFAYETATYGVYFEITCERQAHHLQDWQKAAYSKLVEGYDNKVREYELQLQALESEAKVLETERSFDDNPSLHLKVIHGELKKHCISIITRQWYDSFQATTTDAPPRFNFDRAMLEGNYIRFFEQAYEWDQLQYVAYPYHWARKDTWVERFSRQESDPVYQEFLQAGAARVVVPVRPGFELAVNHFMETGNIWNGDGEPPTIGSPTYVSIVEEIMQRTGAPQGETTVGAPWDVRVPTRVVLLKETRELPGWEREADDTWVWSPKDEAAGGGN